MQAFGFCRPPYVSVPSCPLGCQPASPCSLELQLHARPPSLKLPSCPHSQVAEYVESRPELAAGLSKKDATLRSASVQFQVQPCQPVTLR